MCWYKGKLQEKQDTQMQEKMGKNGLQENLWILWGYEGLLLDNDTDDDNICDAHKAPDQKEFINLLSAIKLNPNKEIDVVIEFWDDPFLLQKKYNELYVFLNENNINVFIN